MPGNKLDLTVAWLTLTGLYRAHQSLLLLLVGLFLFVPLCFAGILLGQLEVRPGATDAQMNKLVAEFLGNNWYWFVLITFVARFGELAMSMLLLDKSLPTLKDILLASLALLATFLAATIMVNVATLLISSVPTGAGALAALVSMLLFTAVVFLTVRFSLLSAIIAAEKIANPLHAIKRSWELTRGHTARIFLFYFAVIFITLLCGFMLWIFLSFILDMALPMAVAQPITLALGAILFAAIAMVATLQSAAVFRLLAISEN